VSRPKQPTICPHPDLPNHAFGLCVHCYREQRKKNGVRATCHPEEPEHSQRLCKRCYMAAYNKSEARWRVYYLNRYGLTLERYKAMLMAQQNRCKACGDDFAERPCVDHDHKCCPGTKSCGKCIRALLCCRCNLLLGNAGDDVQLLQKSIAYLQRHDGTPEQLAAA
jgi:hypothetical protein